MIIDNLKSLFKKEPKKVNRENFPPYVAQRWISFHSGAMATVLNKILNQSSELLADPQMCYDFLRTILPPMSSHIPTYIKKPKEGKSGGLDSNLLHNISKNLEMSEKDLKDLLLRHPEIADEWKEDVKVFRRRTLEE
jgi:hypothetical protein